MDYSAVVHFSDSETEDQSRTSVGEDRKIPPGKVHSESA